MNLQISNFAKINNADISINGITVIAGNNNTGKSTVGKVLTSLFDSMVNMEETLKQARYRNINRELRNYISQNFDSENFHFARSRSVIDLISNFSKELFLSENVNYEVLFSNFIDNFNSLNKQNILTEKNIEDIHSIIQSVLKISDESLIKSKVSMYFQDVFNEQINNIETPSNKAEIRLVIKQKELKLDFKDDNIVSLINNIVFTNSATYIDNPFIIDRLNERSRYLFFNTEEHSLSQDLLYKLQLKNDFQYEDEALNKELVSDKLRFVFEKMTDVVPGELIYDNRYKYKYKKNIKPLDVNSLSTGLKSFILLKQLLLNSSLKEKDVLVLDEPEIHLHPEWQLKYAEIIVLLQQAFDLNIVITTHSSHFLEALDLFATIHNSKNTCNYYLAQLNQETGKSDFIDTTDNIEKIYSNLVSPTLALDNIKAKAGLLDE